MIDFGLSVMMLSALLAFLSPAQKSFAHRKWARSPEVPVILTVAFPVSQFDPDPDADLLDRLDRIPTARPSRFI